MRRARLGSQNSIPFALARLLLARGVASDAVADYLHPTLKTLLPEPLTLKDMDKAVARVQVGPRAWRAHRRVRRL